MRKILGTRDMYHDQTNNAQVDLFSDYAGKARMIACGPTSAAMCLRIAGWPMEVFTPGEQAEDAILMVLHNRFNLPLYKKRRMLNYDTFPPNEVPQVYEVAMKIIFKSDQVCLYRPGLSFNIITDLINEGIPMMIAGKFPCGGHYVTVCGYDEEKQVVIFNDPYPPNWPDKKGYNREMTVDFLNSNISRWRVDFFRYPG